MFIYPLVYTITQHVKAASHGTVAISHARAARGRAAQVDERAVHRISLLGKQARHVIGGTRQYCLYSK
jgi:hypothetical protein